MRDYYALCDKLMGELIAPYENDPDTAIAVVSDHGARGMDGGADGHLEIEGVLARRIQVRDPFRVGLRHEMLRREPVR